MKNGWREIEKVRCTKRERMHIKEKVREKQRERERRNEKKGERVRE